jgi:Xaa-Pro aminopeptidase
MKSVILNSLIKKVRELLKAQKADALIVTVGSNVSYLSGFSGDDSWLILTGGKSILVTDSRYTLQAEQECPACRIYQRKGSMIDAVADIFKKIPKVRTAAVEDKIELAVFKILKKKLPVRIKPVKNLVESVRQIKDEYEIAAIRKAIEISQRALEKVLPKIRIGYSETKIAAMLDFEMKQAGANPAFETVVAFGSNSAMAHHHPSARKLKKVDTILIDFGAKLNSPRGEAGGYCADLTRCFATGRVNSFYAKIYKTVLDAQTAAINILKSGIKAKNADSVAREIITRAKLPPYGHGLGHGLGLEVHEQPAVSVLSKDSLQNGDIVTVEPAVYLPGKFGIRIEDDVLITENGCRVLSSTLKNDRVPVLKI